MLKNISVWALLTVSAVLIPTSTQTIDTKPIPVLDIVEDSSSYTPAITAPATAKVSFERVQVTSQPAPKPEPKVVEETPPVVSEPEAPVPAVTQITKQSAQTEAAAPKAVAVSPGSAQAEAANQMKAYGWGADQLNCLVSLWEKESNWNSTAENRSSGAFGIPQSLPGHKMATAGADWKTNPATQIKWGLGYISERYKTPCGAWGHSVSVGWY